MQSVYKSFTEVKGWESYLHYGTRKFVKRNHLIYQQGSQGNGFYYIEKGTVKIVIVTPEGKERLIEIEGKDQLFGEQAMDKKPYFSTAITSEDSIVYHFSCDTFYELASHDREFHALFLETLIRKVRTLADDIVFNNESAEQRLAYSLLKVCFKLNQLKIPLTQEDVSKYTGLTRITVYKVFKKWKSENVIEVNNRMIIIKDLDLLKEYC